MDFQRWSLRCGLFVALFAAGCQPKIGDSCTQHLDCDSAGTRICEPNFPSGYCTIFNCEPNKCPDEAVCVAYTTSPSTKPECADTLDQRFERTFCMRSCSSDSDCRAGGYACVDLQAPNPWGAVVVDTAHPKTKICTIPVSLAADAPSPDETEVCVPPVDASFPLVPGADASVLDAASADASRMPASSSTRLDGGPAEAGAGDATVDR